MKTGDLFIFNGTLRIFIGDDSIKRLRNIKISSGGVCLDGEMSSRVNALDAGYIGASGARKLNINLFDILQKVEL